MGLPLVVAVLFALLAGSGCLPPWPLGDAGPSWVELDDDDATADDDDAADDDDSADDDDVIIDDDDDDDDSTPDPNDLDGDGYVLSEDCDDTNAAVHPGATEVACDGIDNDCDTISPCDPCADGHISEDLTVLAGEHDFISALGVGDDIYGQNGSYYFDLYRFQITTVAWVEFDLESSDFNPWIELWNGSCSSHVSAAGSGTLAELNQWYGPGDVVYVVASSADDLETGGYRLSVRVWGT